MSTLELHQVIDIIKQSNYLLDTFPQYQFKPNNTIYNVQLKDFTNNLGNKNVKDIEIDIEKIKYVIDNKTNINTTIINRYQLTNQHYIYGVDKRIII